MSLVAGKRILVVEDETAARNALRELVGSWGFTVEVAGDGQSALQLVQSYSPDIVLLDLRLPRKDGISVLRALREDGLDTAVVVVSGEGDIPDAVAAIKLGAYDYLTKPVDIAHLKLVLKNLVAHLSIKEENLRLRRRLLYAGELGSGIGESTAMRRVMSMVEQFAPSSASIILLGESGTGKEFVAKTIHQLSPRCDGPYVAINCAALPDTLMESELFGHERGAFTGAERRREGCFELAKGGTLLLDEIAEMKVELQAKLLRVLEERKFRRLGGTSEVEADVRVIAASNRNLEAAIREGKFREDLFFRLNVFSIVLPPLRQRIDDLPLLAGQFLHELSQANGKSIGGIADECLATMMAYDWPGNIRELRNAIERAVVVCNGPQLTSADLPVMAKGRASSAVGRGASFEVLLGASLDQVERELVERTMSFVDGNKTRAAEILGVSLKTLYNRLERYQSKNQSEQSES